MIPPPPEPDSLLSSLCSFACLCVLAFGLVGFILRAYPREEQK